MDARGLAERAVSRVEASPVEAHRLAAEALQLSRSQRDQGAAAMAERALGRATEKLGDLRTAIVHFRRAARLAASAGLPCEAGRARINLAGALAMRGDRVGAQRQLASAATLLEGSFEALHVVGQQGYLLYLSGRLAEALESFDVVVSGYHRAGAETYEAWARFNRGNVRMHVGTIAEAEADLIRASELYAAHGQHWSAAHVILDLGCVAARRGNLPLSMSRFDQAEEIFRAQGSVPGEAYNDRCDALLAAHLVTEAREVALRAVEELSRRRLAATLAEARLTLCEASLLAGDYATATLEADRARRAFARQGRPGFVALARYASLRAAWAGGQCDTRRLQSARRVADALDTAQWAVAALDARLIVAHIALGLGRPALARAELDRARHARRAGTVELRSRGWHAEALVRLAQGDRRGAESALRSGMRVLDRYRAVLGATELRAHASGHASDLARLGVRLALADGRPGRVLAWAERWRAGSLALRPVRPPADGALAGALAELRGVAAEVKEATESGQPTARLLRRQRNLEEVVRTRARHARGPGLGTPLPVPGLAVLRGSLGGRLLVELVESDGSLYAVVVPGRDARSSRARLHCLGRASEAAGELDALRFALRRLARPGGRDASRAAAATAAAHAAQRLDDLLLAPVRKWDTPLVIVAPGALQAVPWSALPSCAGRPVVVSPSAAVWHAAQHEAGSSAGDVVLVAGPRLAAAAMEVEEISRRYPKARCLTGTDARVELVSAALDGARIAHVASHGEFRADNPLMSCLQLADGPLTVYDLERLERTPRLLVLAACDSGLSDVRPGDEILGLAAALFALGTRTLMASVIPVPDELTRPVMVSLHDSLSSGLPPAAALARAQVTAAGDARSEAWAAATAFVCFGAS